MRTKGLGSKRVTAAAGTTLQGTTKKTGGRPPSQVGKPGLQAGPLDGGDFDARLDAAHARIDGVLRRLG